MFIELTMSGSGDKWYVNIDKIQHIKTHEENGTTLLYINRNEGYQVKESYDQVKQLIKNEVAAERGY